MSSPERARRIADLFDALLELDAGQRAAYLDEACGDDGELRQEVERLLRLHEAQDTDRLFPPLFLDDPAASLVGKQMGPYRILRRIAEGGMGAVCLAGREDVAMQVALKLIRHGRQAAPEHIQRLLLERRVLARLRHPNIAGLLDAGVTEERLPYLVMEYVEGTPITGYCDEQRLSVDERLRLFQEVCAAVQYAHRSLIVHRDLKPSNILVDRTGRVKLLDFGIAKLLDEEEAGQQPLTRMGGAPLIPEYASPEQVRHEPITTASDVYSLGVVLYELLTGHRPYRIRSRAPGEVERVVCSTDPARPSAAVLSNEEVVHSDGVSERITPDAVSQARRTQPLRLRRRLGGELDTIILKALAKEPDRRYPSAQELADDLERHLSGLPVRAHRDTLRYRTGKFMRRHRIGVAASGAVFLALLIGLAAALWQTREAHRQRDLAALSARTMIFELAEGLSRMSGPTQSRLGLLTRAAEVFEAIGIGGSATGEHQRVTADAYRVLAQTYTALGDAEHALRYATLAEQRARELRARGGVSAEDRLLLAGVLVELGDALTTGGEQDSALVVYAEALGLADSLAAAPAASAEVLRAQYLALSRRADRLVDHAGRVAEAAPLDRRAYQVSERLVQSHPQNPQYHGFHGTSLTRLADLQYYENRIPESCVYYHQALTLRQRASDLAPGDAALLRSLANALLNAAWCSETEGSLEETTRLFTRANDLLRRLLASDPANLGLATELMGGVGQFGNTLRAQGDLEGAMAQYRQAIRVGEEFRARGVAAPSVIKQTVAMLELLAQLLLRSGQSAEAARTLEAARATLIKAREREPGNIEYPRSLAYVLTTIGALLRSQGEIAPRLAHHQEALAIYRSVADATGLPQDRQMVAYAHYRLAMALKQAGRQAEARRELQTGREMLLALRAAGQLTDASDGYQQYLPAIEQALQDL